MVTASTLYEITLQSIAKTRQQVFDVTTPIPKSIFNDICVYLKENDTFHLDVFQKIISTDIIDKNSSLKTEYLLNIFRRFCDLEIVHGIYEKLAEMYTNRRFGPNEVENHLDLGLSLGDFLCITGSFEKALYIYRHCFKRCKKNNNNSLRHLIRIVNILEGILIAETKTKEFQSAYDSIQKIKHYISYIREYNLNINLASVYRKIAQFNRLAARYESKTSAKFTDFILQYNGDRVTPLKMSKTWIEKAIIEINSSVSKREIINIYLLAAKICFHSKDLLKTNDYLNEAIQTYLTIKPYEEYFKDLLFADILINYIYILIPKNQKKGIYVPMYNDLLEFFHLKGSTFVSQTFLLKNEKDWSYKQSSSDEDDPFEFRNYSNTRNCKIPSEIYFKIISIYEMAFGIKSSVSKCVSESVCYNKWRDHFKMNVFADIFE